MASEQIRTRLDYADVISDGNLVKIQDSEGIIATFDKTGYHIQAFEYHVPVQPLTLIHHPMVGGFARGWERFLTECSTQLGAVVSDVHRPEWAK